MSRGGVTRGRMLPEDARRLKMSLRYIEQEVDGGHLVTSLFTAEIIDNDDREIINTCQTRLQRIQRLIDILFNRGEGGFKEFLKSLDGAGYSHVADRLRNPVSAPATPSSEEADINTFNVDSTVASTDFIACEPSLINAIFTGLTNIEELSRRVTQAESSTGTSLPNLNKLKGKLQDVKWETQQQIMSLKLEMVEKTAKIEKLEGENAELVQAREKIKLLEQSIGTLEKDKVILEKDVKYLKKCLKDTEEQTEKLNENLNNLEVRLDKLEDESNKNKERNDFQKNHVVEEHLHLAENQKQVSFVTQFIVTDSSTFDHDPPNLNKLCIYGKAANVSNINPRLTARREKRPLARSVNKW